MLRRLYRLTSEKDVRHVYRSRFVVRTRILDIRLAKNNLKHPRFTVVVSTKISKSAVVRNRIKRQIRATLAQYALQPGPGYDVIVITKAGILAVKPEERQELLTHAFTKMKLWPKESKN